jgi:N-carbamoyl-L-amino-acid hydrolase
MSRESAPLSIDVARFKSDLEALNAIGWTKDGGLARTAFSAAHLQAREWFMGRARAANMQTRIDSAANHSAVLPARDPGAPTLLIGSHLDSVPGGGRYDGALGVLCALEVLRSVKDSGLELPCNLEAIDFTDEEGTLVGTLGSWALTGTLSPETLASPRCGRDVLLAELDRMSLTEEGLLSAARDPATLAGFLELHVEQGPVLEREGIDIGVVTGMRGNCSFEVVFTGDARHAGTTPMDARRDAGVGAAAFVLGVRETVTRDFPGCVANIGDIQIEPGSFNVVPARAQLQMECRSLDDAELDVLAAKLSERARSEAARWNLGVEVRRVGRWAPAPTDERVRRAFADASDRLGLSSMQMPSGAGHDAQVLANVTSSGMVFVPSSGGISHHPSEHTSLRDCVNGANVLLTATVALAQSL